MAYERNTSPRMATEEDRLVGMRLGTLRKARGLSQADLGRAVGVTFQQVRKYETGQNRVGAGRLRAFAQLLQVPVSVFFEDDTAEADSSAGLFTHLSAPGALDLLGIYAALPDDRRRRQVLEIMRILAELAKPAEVA